jgi:hypothetical protein
MTNSIEHYTAIDAALCAEYYAQCSEREYESAYMAGVLLVLVSQLITADEKTRCRAEKRAHELIARGKQLIAAQQNGDKKNGN